MSKIGRIVGYAVLSSLAIILVLFVYGNVKYSGINSDATTFVEQFELRVGLDAEVSEDYHEYTEGLTFTGYPATWKMAMCLSFEAKLFQHDLDNQRLVDEGDDHYRLHIGNSSEKRLDFYSIQYSTPEVSESMLAIKEASIDFKEYLDLPANDKDGKAQLLATETVLQEASWVEDIALSEMAFNNLIRNLLIWDLAFTCLIYIPVFVVFRKSSDKKKHQV